MQRVEPQILPLEVLAPGRDVERARILDFPSRPVPAQAEPVPAGPHPASASHHSPDLDPFGIGLLSRTPSPEDSPDRRTPVDDEPDDSDYAAPAPSAATPVERHPERPPASAVDPLEGLGTEGFAAQARRHQALHQSSIDRLFGQNEALVRHATRLDLELVAVTTALRSARSALAEQVASSQARDRRLLELEAELATERRVSDAYAAELNKAYEMIDGHRQAADEFLADALSATSAPRGPSR